MKAYVNHGRWVADCPIPFCGQAWLADRIPVECENCGQPPGPIEWPTEQERIESLLAVRPVPQTRNWLPGETVDDLIAENVVMFGVN